MGEIADALRRTGAGPAPGETGRESPTRGPRIDTGLGRGLPAPPATRPLRPTDPAIISEEGPELEACRQLALRLRSELRRRGARSVAVVSPLRDDGKTTSSCNLALALASLESARHVALVGLDLRRPCLARVLGIEVTVGVEQVLAGNASLDDARVALEEPALDVYAALTPQRAAHEILTQGHLSELIPALEHHYDVVIVDTPPVLLVPDARLILECVSVCLPVARAGRTRVRSFREMLDALPPHQVLSTVLNGSRRRGHYYHGYDYIGELDGDEESDGHERSERGRRG